MITTLSSLTSVAGAVLALAGGVPAPTATTPAEMIAESYLEHHFEMFPSRALAAGLHHHDRRLEDFSPERLKKWVAFNRTAAETFRDRLADASLPIADRRDAELLLREAERQVFAHEVLQRPARDPLYWTGVAANATVFLLVRDDQPLTERLESAAARARLLPRLAAQARAALGQTPPEDISPEIAEIAAGQARSSARFYAEGFAGAAEDPKLRAELREAGAAASAGLAELADFLDALAETASASPRLGDGYPELFRLATGVETSVPEVLARAEAALGEKRREIAAYGREIWPTVFPEADFPEKEPPEDDAELIRTLFGRIAEDRATSTDAFIRQYRALIDEAIRFVRERGIITLPDPLTVHADRSPSYFVGQAVGGVYPAGPYAPESATLLFLPTPPDALTDEEKAAFFRDFNDHFNRMITPHEIVPGHTLQLAWAARHPKKLRALFADGVYVEGWGTFCERLMLDLGWGGPLDRLAHLKKQLENIARTIVDIRVHTAGMSRDEVVAFVRGEALQDARFAANMWRRAITSSPQLTTYFLGYEEVYGLYEDVRAARGEAFDLREFMDAMMEMGPVPVRHYRDEILGAPGASPTDTKNSPAASM